MDAGRKGHYLLVFGVAGGDALRFAIEFFPFPLARLGLDLLLNRQQPVAIAIAGFAPPLPIERLASASQQIREARLLGEAALHQGQRFFRATLLQQGLSAATGCLDFRQPRIDRGLQCRP